MHGILTVNTRFSGGRPGARFLMGRGLGPWPHPAWLLDLPRSRTTSYYKLLSLTYKVLTTTCLLYTSDAADE